MSASATGSDAHGAKPPDRDAMQVAMAQFLTAAGLADVAVSDAAARSAEAWTDALLSGYRTDPATVLECTFDEVDGDLVTLSSIPFVSVCSHHLLPFFGQAHVAYLPGERLLGLGRIEDLVHCLSRRLQLQERLGQEIVRHLADQLGARGVACVLEAEHLCVFARGKRQRGPIARTTAFAGDLRDDPAFRQQCLALLGGFTTGTTRIEEHEE
jgi:GTP cyclohydrolase I